MPRPQPPSGDPAGPPRLRVLEAVRRGLRTVNDLAAHLGVSDNAVRSHLVSLEADGLVCIAGVVRSGVAGKPAAEYDVTADAERSLSRAYAPALEALIVALSDRLKPRALRAALEDAGRRLAPARARPASLAAGAKVARDLLTDLGGAVQLELRRSDATLRGTGCPLAAAVAREPATCRMVESMLATTTGRAVEQLCDHGERPCCRFRLT